MLTQELGQFQGQRASIGKPPGGFQQKLFGLRTLTGPGQGVHFLFAGLHTNPETLAERGPAFTGSRPVFPLHGKAGSLHHQAGMIRVIGHGYFQAFFGFVGESQCNQGFTFSLTGTGRFAETGLQGTPPLQCLRPVASMGGQSGPLGSQQRIRRPAFRGTLQQGFRLVNLPRLNQHPALLQVAVSRTLETGVKGLPAGDGLGPVLAVACQRGLTHDQGGIRGELFHTVLNQAFGLFAPVQVHEGTGSLVVGERGSGTTFTQFGPEIDGFLPVAGFHGPVGQFEGFVGLLQGLGFGLRAFAGGSGNGVHAAISVIRGIQWSGYPGYARDHAASPRVRWSGSGHRLRWGGPPVPTRSCHHDWSGCG